MKLYCVKSRSYTHFSRHHRWAKEQQYHLCFANVVRGHWENQGQMQKPAQKVAKIMRLALRVISWLTEGEGRRGIIVDTEYQSVCTFVGIGSHHSPPPQASVSPPWTQRKGGPNLYFSLRSRMSRTHNFSEFLLPMNHRSGNILRLCEKKTPLLKNWNRNVCQM